MGTTRTFGITVLGDFLLSEGVDSILENLERTGVTAVACNPTVTAAANENEGSYQPPIDAGSSPRVFDRPLFGKHALWVRSGPSYHPKPQFYEGCSYQPREANELTGLYGSVIRKFVDGALERGMEVHFQLAAARPSGLRDEDRPRLPGGELPDGRMADTGSLASPAIRQYNRAYLQDLLTEYPQISGIRIDWPEYPCYTPVEIFQDFSPHVEAWANERGFDFPTIRTAAKDAWNFLRGDLQNEHLEDFTDVDRGKWSLVNLLLNHPALADWLRMKSELSTDIIQTWRNDLTEFGGEEKKLIAHAFMPPYTTFTGLHFGRASHIADVVAPKLYTMHWSMMIEFWGRFLLNGNPHLDEELLAQTLEQLTDLVEEPAANSLEDYGYPQPGEPHPISEGAQLRKIQQAITAAGSAEKICPMVHGYGPLNDVTRRFELAAGTNAGAVWINRYGYLSDEKLEAIGDIWKQSNARK